MSQTSEFTKISLTLLWEVVASTFKNEKRAKKSIYVMLKGAVSKYQEFYEINATGLVLDFDVHHFSWRILPTA